MTFDDTTPILDRIGALEDAVTAAAVSGKVRLRSRMIGSTIELPVRKAVALLAVETVDWDILSPVRKRAAK